MGSLSLGLHRADEFLLLEQLGQSRRIIPVIRHGKQVKGKTRTNSAAGVEYADIYGKPQGIIDQLL